MTTQLKMHSVNSVHHPIPCREGRKESSDRIEALRAELFPLTDPSLDRKGNTIQIWAVPGAEMVGVVKKSDGSMRYITSANIRNSMNLEEDATTLYNRLLCGIKSSWDFSLDESGRLVIWPHMDAAGWWKALPQKDAHGTPQLRGLTTLARTKTREQMIAWFYTNGFQPTCNKGYAKVEIYFGDTHQASYDASEHASIANMLCQLGQKAHIKSVNVLRPNYRSDEFVGRGLVFQHPKDRNKTEFNVDYSTHHGAPEREGGCHIDVKAEGVHVANLNKPKISTQETYRANHQARTAGQAKPYILGASIGAQKPHGPGVAAFRQLVQEAGLAITYKASNPNSQIPPKGVAGEIGGVACSTEYIEGLFDDPCSLLWNDHYFCFPTLPNGKMPFTDDQFQQILRELATGIYVHSTTPFFSLHFREEGSDLFPIIHPVYEGTLIGRIIGMLDYIMKGYLNGGVYQSDFIDEWRKNPDWKTREGEALHKLIDFTKYCEEEMVGADQQYISLSAIKSMAEGDPTLPVILRSFTGFNNSFRIIAKQKSIQKEGNVFAIDADFDVFYDIVPSPEYKKAFDEYVRTHGTPPAAHIEMENLYQMMAKKIHEHMAKMPLCQEYFSMLSVISFFASYFSTLKKEGKIPSLTPMTISDPKGCPALFPHLPITTHQKETLKVNKRQVFHAYLQQEEKTLKQYLKKMYQHVLNGNQGEFNPAEKRAIITRFEEFFRQDLLSHCYPPLRRHLETVCEKDLQKIVTTLGGACIKNLIDFFQDNLLALRQSIDSIGSGFFNYLAKTDEYSKYTNPESIQKSIQNVIELFRNLPSETVEIGSLTISITRLPHEIQEREIQTIRKVVGGCGLAMKAQTIGSSLLAQRLLRLDTAKLLAVQRESLTPLIDAEGVSRAVVRLSFEDAPLDEDYLTEMDSLLLIPQGVDQEDVEMGLAIQEAMYSGDKTHFTEFVETSHDIHKIKDRFQKNPLHHAAMVPDLFYLDHLLSKGLSAKAEDVNGYLPIHYAAMVGNIAALEKLIPLSSIDAAAYNRGTPLIVAVQHSQVEAATFLLRKGARLTCLMSGYTILHSAIHEGNPAIIEALLKNDGIRSMINTVSREGGTPLMLACELGSRDLVNKLIDLGASVATSHFDGTTAMEIAIRRGDESILDLLLSHACPSELALEAAATYGSETMVKKLLQPLYAYKNPSQDNALHIAIRAGNLEAAQVLIENCSELPFFQMRNREDQTPLSLTFALNLESLIEAFLKKGATTDLEPLFRARYSPHLISMLEDHTFTTEQLQQYGRIAAEAGRFETISHVLVSKGLKLEEIQWPNGWTLLHYLAKFDGLFLFRSMLKPTTDLQPLAAIAAEYGSKRVLKAAIVAMEGRQISQARIAGAKHLLLIAIEGGVEEVVLESREGSKAIGIPLDDRDSYAIHVAARMGSLKALQAVVQKGIDVNVTDRAGLTPFDYVERTGFKKAINFLKGVGAHPGIAALQAQTRQLAENNIPHAANFFEAFTKNNLLEMRELLKKYPPNQLIAVDFGIMKMVGTPLQLLVRLSKEHDVKELIAEELARDDIDFNLLDEEGNNLAHLLLEVDRSPIGLRNIDLEKPNLVGATPLHVAAGYASERLFNAFLDKLTQEEKLALLDQQDKTGESPLFDAILQGKLENVIALLKKGVNVNHYNYELMTPLAVACCMGNTLIVQELLRAGANPNQRIKAQRATLLHLVMGAQNYQLFLMLLLAGADSSMIGEDGISLIHLAASIGDRRFIQLLHGQGLSLTIEDSSGKSPAAYAVIQGNLENLQKISDLVEDKEALLNNISSFSQEKKKAPTNLLGFAALQGEAPTARWLLDQGAQVELNQEKELAPFSWAIAGNAPQLTAPLFDRFKVSEESASLRSALMLAIINDRVDGIMMIYNRGIHVDFALNGGFTGIQFATYHGAIQCTLWLLAQGADTTLQTPTGESLFEFAAVNNSADQFRRLLNYARPDLNQVNMQGESLAHLAAKKGNLGHLLVLKAMGAEMNIVNQLGFTPLYVAATAGHAQIVNFLLALESDPTKYEGLTSPDQKTQEMINRFRQPLSGTSLHRATRTRSLEVLKMLTELSTLHEINQVDAEGRTPLSYAKQMGFTEGAQALILGGAI